MSVWFRARSTRVAEIAKLHILVEGRLPIDSKTRMGTTTTPNRRPPPNNSSSLPRTPPSQIFTRGKVGAVVLQSRNNGGRSTPPPPPHRSNATVISNSSSSGGNNTHVRSTSRSQTRDDQAASSRNTNRSRSRPRSLSRGRRPSNSHRSLNGNGSDIHSMTSFPPRKHYQSNREASPSVASTDTAGSTRRRRHLRKTKLIMDGKLLRKRSKLALRSKRIGPIASLSFLTRSHNFQN